MMTAIERQDLPGPAEMPVDEWFKPGNILWCHYWENHSLVVSFDPGSDGLWEVTVVECDQYGNRMEGAKERTHFTSPGRLDRLVGTV